MMKEKMFSKTHEWIKIENNTAKVGITDHAQKELGEIVFIELPKIGDQISKSSVFATVESTKSASDVISPLSGEIIEINADLVNNPQWINESPYEKGWMITITLTDPRETESLFDEPAYREFVSQENSQH